MYRKLVFSLCLVLFSAAMVVAQDTGSTGSGDSDAKMVTGMSILGNDEAPNVAVYRSLEKFRDGSRDEPEQNVE